MSEAEKTENMENEVPAGTNASALSAESQDFRLVDMEDFDDDDLPNADSLLVEKEHKDFAVNESADVQVCTDMGKTEDEQALTNDNSERNKPSDEKDDASLKVMLEEQESRIANDENEILGELASNQSMPEKPGSVNADRISGKRKAESDDEETMESAKKISKTSILDDAKTLDKRKFEKEDNESSASDNSSITCPNITMQSNVIIEETQDMEDEAATCMTDEIFTEDLEEKKSVNCQAEECETMKKHFGPLDELDKDENLNNSTKSAENVLTDTENPLTDGTVKDNITLHTDDKANSMTDDKVKENFVINCESKENFLMDTTESLMENAMTKDDRKESSDVVIPSDSVHEEINVNFTPTQHTDCPSAIIGDIVKKKRSEEDTEMGGIRNVGDKDGKRNWACKDESSPVKKEGKAFPKVPGNSNKPRMSIEVIFDSCLSDEKISRAKELVEIDEEGEKIVLDSSQEDSQEGRAVDNGTVADGRKVENVNKSIYDNQSNSSDKLTDSSKDGTMIFKSDGRVTNDSGEYKRTDTDTTVSLGSDLMGNEATEIGGAYSRVKVKDKENLAAEAKDVDHSDPLLSISENEVNVSKEEGTRNKSAASDSGFIQGSSLTKALQVEKEVGIYVKLKCLLQIDESSKELLAKELVAVQCESTGESSPAQKVNDTSASLADISGNENKDSSPGSVHSNPQLFALNPSRLSIVSSVSSSSSASSAASLAAKLMGKDTMHFSLPRAPPAKHMKKSTQDISQVGSKFDELFERLTREWKNSQLLTTNVLSFLNTELANMENYNASSGHLDDQIQKILSSTPEVHKEMQLKGTPKSTRRGKPTKRPYHEENSLTSTAGKKNNRQGTFVGAPVNADHHVDNTKMKKLMKSEISEETSGDTVAECDLIGKEVFAKWSDNNYYPGKVVDKVKAKYKVNFYDGHSKLLIEPFIIRLPKILNKGLSVYATTTQDDYGSSGIIVDVGEKDDGTYYTVETDDKGKLEVQMKDIFLSPDQAQVFKEEVNVNPPSLPSTPKHLAQITLDNTVDGKRRSRRVATPVFSTPKSRKRKESTSAGRVLNPEPSGSGLTPKGKRRIDETAASAKSEDLSSDSSVSVKEEFLFGVHPEAIGTPNEQNVKGTQRKIKGKARSKKRTDDGEIIQRLGPIPQENSNIFAGMSFLLTCASLENIDRFRADNKESNSETATENEEQWVEIPFVRDRLKTQITAGGGQIYDEFDTIPEEEYEKTKLITNVPNNTAKSLLCLSVGIPSYNHKWIVRCCQQNAIVNPAEEELPTGWSLEKQCYVEKFQRASKKPLINMIVIIPNMVSNKDFVEFWRQICENAGAVIVLVENPESMEGFVEDTVVVTNHRCPSWAVEKAYNLHIPLLSTTWVVQCLVEGKVCAFDAHPRYKYNYVQ